MEAFIRCKTEELLRSSCARKVQRRWRAFAATRNPTAGLVQAFGATGVTGGCSSPPCVTYDYPRPSYLRNSCECLPVALSYRNSGKVVGAIQH